CLFFFFQAEDGIRDFHVTGVQTCALPIFHCNLEAENAVVQVINYGHSIPPEELPYIFDMFYTVDKARTEREGSSGIGLFIAKNKIGRASCREREEMWDVDGAGRETATLHG